MDHTDFKAAIRDLCERRPDFRKKLAAEVRREAGIHDDYMSWQALLKVIDRAPDILEMLRDSGEDLEDWQETKIQLAAEYLDAVYDSMSYDPDFAGALGEESEDEDEDDDDEELESE
jgi:hypothetical protein